MSGVDVRLYDHSDDVLDRLPPAINNAREAIGMKAEGYAKQKCPVDTGRLRNSITHAVSDREQAVYIGTATSYAPYVEYGTVKMKARPFLKPAVMDHIDEYKRLAEAAMKWD
jgi:HK97 gp10 family phage protein